MARKIRRFLMSCELQNMSKQFELLAPGGDLESIKAAIVAGADAVYCGLGKFNARNKATNLSLDDLNGVVRLAHQYDCEVFLTLNIIMLEQEIPELVRLLNTLVNTNIDGVIVQDLGLAYILKHHFPTMDVHASTQFNTHNEGQVALLGQLTASRVNLSRELNIDEITQLASYGRDHNVLMEVFVHGSYCVSFSGLCYISSLQNGASGNRGRCRQSCREQYQPTDAGKNYPLNMKDNSAFYDMDALAKAGVYSLKVEGRIKKSHYVYTVVDNWRKQIDRYCDNKPLLADNSELHTVFNRDFSNGFLMGNISNAMFIDNPRDNAAHHLAQQEQASTPQQLTDIKKRLYDKKTDIIGTVREKVAHLDTDKWPITVTLSGKINRPLIVTIKTPSRHFSVQSDSVLTSSSKYGFDQCSVEKWLNGLNDIDHIIERIDLTELSCDLYLPFSEQAKMREQLVQALNNDRLITPEVVLPRVESPQKSKFKPKLAALLSDVDNLSDIDDDIELYYPLPETLYVESESTIALLQQFPRLVPYFPAIVIGKDFDAAKKILDDVKPKRIVTNNSGIGYLAYQRGIEWLAGPQMNLSNSYALKCLKDEFNCSGAFISNELNQKQIKRIVAPQGFELHYCMYQPNALMISRQCLFHQTVGCRRKRFDARCLTKCEKTASILNLKDSAFVLDKQKGHHNIVYAEYNMLNTEVLEQPSNNFDGMMVDLRPIKTHTQRTSNTASLVKEFKLAIAGERHNLHGQLQPTCNKQYKKGL
jgi:putative protease